MFSFQRFFTFLLCGAQCLFAQSKPTLRPSPEHHQAENNQADADGLTRFKNQADIDRLVAAGLLVPLPEDESIEIDKKIPANRRYCRPWTKTFLLNIGPSYKVKFNKKIKVTSGIRSWADQEELLKHNQNASPTSTHPTGATVDISWKGMHRQEVAWFAGQLLALQRAGKVIATQEQHHQACFHVLVLKEYSKAPTPAKKSPSKKAAPKKGGK